MRVHLVRPDSRASKQACPRGPVDAPERPALGHELLLGLAVFAVYSVVAGATLSGGRAAARSHARDIFDLEQDLHLDIERPMNTWLVHHDVVRVAANYEYAFTYILSASLLLGWLYARQPELYRWARTSFIVLNLVAFTVFAGYPVAPPRLFPDLGFVDTVTRGHTFGSWGDGMVDHANSLAAMPSLHLGWALWVSVVLGMIAGSVRTQLVSSVHVLVTLLVIMATANHFALDAVGGAACVMVSLPIAGMLSHRSRDHTRRPERVAAADAFFLYVESPTSPQHVGGLLLLDHDGHPERPTRDALEAVVRAELDQLPRFRQRLSPASRWRRPRWVDAPDLDWSWHITTHDLAGESGTPAGRAALGAYVAELASTPLPRDRPLWRLISVTGVTAQQSAVVFIAHHVIADGFGTVAQALRLLQPPVPTLEVDAAALPGPVKRLAATVTGLAQLATDGRPQQPFVGADSAGRGFGAVTLPLAQVRQLAKGLDVRVTDVVLCIVAGALARAADPARLATLSQLRTSVPVMVPRAGAAVEGNATGTAMLDLPLRAQSEPSRLADIAARSGRLQRRHPGAGVAFRHGRRR